jgi:thiol:disulfide interchange protein/DsbC/DsbD-like thiol-disulfide interchange protein
MRASTPGRRVATLLAALLLPLLGKPALADPLPEGPGVSAVARTSHVTTQLIAERDAVAPGRAVQVVLDQTIIPGWHTYWLNPGETGLPTRLEWTLPPGWTAGPIRWPTPEKMMVGPIVNYGYEGNVRQLIELRAPADATPGAPVTITGQASWLVCQDMCVPERAKLVLTLGVAGDGGAPVTGAGALFREAAAALPRVGDLKVSFVQEGGVSRLDWAADPAVRTAYFFSEDKTVLGPGVGQTLSRDANGHHLTFATPLTLGSAPLRGILALDGRGIAIELAPADTAEAIPPKGKSSALTSGDSVLGLLQAALLALLGGAILNLMPCVFPVLSMKAFALARHGQTHARRHGLVYAAGVVLCFIGIAAILLALRASGSQIGWGFQLQSPIVVAILVYVMLLLALSMSGVFMIGTSAMGVGSGLADRAGLSGSFFTGVLATVVAAPCTAPFMGAVVGYALLQPWWVALVVFAALGLGMALPFVLLTCFDPLLRRMPKPGMWMERLKQILAFPLYATAAWLIWVLTVQTGASGLATVLAGAVLVAFASYLYGQNLSGAWRWIGRSVALVAVLAAVVLPVAALTGPAARSADIRGSDTGTLVFSDAAVSTALAAGKPVFVDFTAAWCITCLANERIALSREAVQAAMLHKNVVCMKADWTNQDSAITVALQKFGRSGVPLYLLYAPNQAEPHILPQILTERLVLDAIDTLPDL